MRQMRVLVADDNYDVRETIRYRLAAEGGFDLYTTSNGLETLGAARILMPELILLDAMMPGENGYRVARAIRDDEKAGVYQRPAEILLLTARDLSSDPEREALFKEFSGVDDVIYKPFDLEALVRRITKLRSERWAA